MVKAWDLKTDPGGFQPPAELVDIKSLYHRTGVEYFKIDVTDHENDPRLTGLRAERGYSYQDMLEVQRTSLNYHQLVSRFWDEHLHADEEIRLVLGGEGYFDVRDVTDGWIRVQVTQGDMLILPAGIYHRFQLGPDEYIKLARYFCGEPVWKAHNRPADDMTCRQEYRRLMEKITAKTQG